MEPNTFLHLNSQIETILNNNLSSLSRQNWTYDHQSRSRLDKIEYSAGYFDEITVDEMYSAYKRYGLAKRIVNAYPEACWKAQPLVFEDPDPDNETAFEAAWNSTNKRVKLLSALANADSLCGIGRYGVVLLGIDDGKELHEPVDGFNEDIFSEAGGGNRHRLTFVRPISERFTRIDTLDHDPTSQRYGLPTQYSVQLGSVTDGSKEAADKQLDYYHVHWHRILHVTDLTDETMVYSSPRLQPVFNDFLDAIKVSAGSAEAYWQGALPGLTFKLDPGYEGIDEESLKTQMSDYAENMRRYISAVGVTVNTLSPNVVDPTPHLDGKLTMISIGTGIPKRILMGTEEGKLAGEQDGNNWADRVAARRSNHVEPNILMRCIEHLQRAQILPPAEEVNVQWESAHESSDLDKAEVALKQTEALSKFAASGMENLISLGDFLDVILRMDQNTIDSITSKLEAYDDAPGVMADLAEERSEASAEAAHARAKDMQQVSSKDANGDEDGEE